MGCLNALSKVLEQLSISGTKHQESWLIVHSPLCGATLLSHTCHRRVSLGKISKIVGRSIVYLKMPGLLEERYYGWEVLERKGCVGREIKCDLINSHHSTP